MPKQEKKSQKSHANTAEASLGRMLKTLGPYLPKRDMGAPEPARQWQLEQTPIISPTHNASPREAKRLLK